MKLREWEEVARARWTEGLCFSVLRRRGTPGRGRARGKYWACRADCWAVKVERWIGSWAQAWKISLA